ncbi:MAG: alpha-glucosidase [Haloarculaceae archaeon]
MSAARQWWKEAVVYQIYPRSFADSDGDGLGDLRGIAGKVDYLDDLGVDAVWLCPFYESPQADMGYDVSDYRAVDDRFGDVGDFEDLLAALHERDIKLVVDQVVNHTSDEHEWFEQSRSSVDDPRRDWYHWHSGTDGGPPNNWESFMGGSAWEYDDRTGEYYLHTFHRKQPDLNWANPEVREAIYEMLRWWLEKGVDGFRMDVINYLSKPEGYPDGDPDAERTGKELFGNGPRLREYLRELDAEVFSDYDVMVVGETSDVDVETARGYIEDGLDMTFQFEHMGVDCGPGGRWDPVAFDLREFKAVIDRWQTGMYPDGWNAPYLGNHDQPRAVSRFGDAAERHSAKLLATFLLTLRGTPFVYQGDEIGMANPDFETLSELRDPHTIHAAEALMERRNCSYDDVRPLVNARGRDSARTPVQWDDSPNAGFTDGDPWLPVCDDFETVNVERERADPDSVWHYYRRLLSLRHETDALVDGAFDLLYPDHERLFAYTRATDDETVLVVLNWSDARTTFDLPDALPADGWSLYASNYDGRAELPSLDLRPYEARVYGR